MGACASKHEEGEGPSSQDTVIKVRPGSKASTNTTGSSVQADVYVANGARGSTGGRTSTKHVGFVESAIDSIKERAASFTSSVSEGLASEAFADAVNSLRENSNSNSGKRGRRRSADQKRTSPAAAAATAAAATTTNRTSPQRAEMQGGVSPATSPAPGAAPPSPGQGGAAPPSAMGGKRSRSKGRQGHRAVSFADHDIVTTVEAANAALAAAAAAAAAHTAAAAPAPGVTAGEQQGTGNTPTKPKSRLAATTDARKGPDTGPAPPTLTTVSPGPRTPPHVADLPPPPPLTPPAARGGSSEPGLWVLRRTGNVLDKYSLSEALGKGQFGVVRVAKDKREGSKWACKSVSKRRVQGMHDFSMEDVLREVEVLYLVGGHPGVVGLREVYEDDEELHLVMELCMGGDWFERLITYGRYTEAEAAAVIRAVLEALAYCHSLGVMHRDIKPENIMFTDRTDSASVKLTDFGLSAMFVEGGEPLSEVLGSAYYVAPEVLRERYSKEADIWSTGVVMFIALGGYAPFDGANEKEVFKKILYEPLAFADPSWVDISSGAKEVISRMLTKDPRKRATIPELLAHPWLATCAGTLPAPTFLGLPASTAAGAPPAHAAHAHALGTAAAGAAAAAGGHHLLLVGARTPSTTEPTNGASGDADGDAVTSVTPSGISLNTAFSRRLPRGSVAAAVSAAVKKGRAVKAVPDAVVARLQAFAAMNAFKREARRVLAAMLPEEEVMGLAAIFKAMDADGDGVLSLRELRDALAGRGVVVTDKHAKVLLERTDLDGDGAVDYEEFLAATLHLARMERDERLWRAFRHFDTQGTGYITRDQLSAALAPLMPRHKIDVDKILAEVDSDGDGRICYGDFCDMLRNSGHPEPSAGMGPGVTGAGGEGAAWGEATESGRLLLAMPGADSRATTRATSLATSRATSSNDRSANSANGHMAAAVARALASMGGTSMRSESRFAPTRSARPSAPGNESVGHGVPSSASGASSAAGGGARRLVHGGGQSGNSNGTGGGGGRSLNVRPSLAAMRGGSVRSTATSIRSRMGGSSRFASMRAAAAAAAADAADRAVAAVDGEDYDDDEEDEEEYEEQEQRRRQGYHAAGGGAPAHGQPGRGRGGLQEPSQDGAGMGGMDDVGSDDPRDKEREAEEVMAYYREQRHRQAEALSSPVGSSVPPDFRSQGSNLTSITTQPDPLSPLSSTPTSPAAAAAAAALLGIPPQGAQYAHHHQQHPNARAPAPPSPTPPGQRASNHAAAGYDESGSRDSSQEGAAVRVSNPSPAEYRRRRSSNLNSPAPNATSPPATGNNNGHAPRPPQSPTPPAQQPIGARAPSPPPRTSPQQQQGMRPGAAWPDGPQGAADSEAVVASYLAQQQSVHSQQAGGGGAGDVSSNAAGAGARRASATEVTGPQNLSHNPHAPHGGQSLKGSVSGCDASAARSAEASVSAFLATIPPNPHAAAAAAHVAAPHPLLVSPPGTIDSFRGGIAAAAAVQEGMAAGEGSTSGLLTFPSPQVTGAPLPDTPKALEPQATSLFFSANSGSEMGRDEGPSSPLAPMGQRASPGGARRSSPLPALVMDAHPLNAGAGHMYVGGQGEQHLPSPSALSPASEGGQRRSPLAARRVRATAEAASAAAPAAGPSAAAAFGSNQVQFAIPASGLIPAAMPSPPPGPRSPTNSPPQPEQRRVSPGYAQTPVVPAVAGAHGAHGHAHAAGGAPHRVSPTHHSTSPRTSPVSPAGGVSATVVTPAGAQVVHVKQQGHNHNHNQQQQTRWPLQQ